MVMNFDNGVPFDPGFVQHISAIIPNIQYVYTELGKYKNFGQKKIQFKMIFPKMDELINNYIGFYAGCILWAQNFAGSSFPKGISVNVSSGCKILYG